MPSKPFAEMVAYLGEVVDRAAAPDGVATIAVRLDPSGVGDVIGEGPDTVAVEALCRDGAGIVDDGVVVAEDAEKAAARDGTGIVDGSAAKSKAIERSRHRGARDDVVGVAIIEPVAEAGSAVGIGCGAGAGNNGVVDRRRRIARRLGAVEIPQAARSAAPAQWRAAKKSGVRPTMSFPSPGFARFPR